MPSPVRAAQAALGRLGSSSELGPTAATVGALLLAGLTAVCGLTWVTIVLLVVSTVGEVFMHRDAPTASLLLHQGSFGVPMRFVMRLAIGTLAWEQADGISALRAYLFVGIAGALVLCGRALHTEYRRVGPLRPMRTRNIPGDPHIDVGPPPRVVEVVTAQLVLLVPALVGAPWWLVVVLGLAAAGWLAALTLPDFRASWAMRSQKRATGFTGPLRKIQDFLDEYQPEVVVHLSGPATAAYQINTWLETLESLPRRVFIVIRDRPLFEKVGSTAIPVLELPNAGEFVMLDFSSVKVALYPTNTGNNIHLLRLPNMMSAFIGHGDSDKSASSNPFSRVYDELWVAGEAGADRYRRSGLNIHEDAYRFVGRPQVHAIGRAPVLGEVDLPTVLYAPTWEGVNHEQEYSSVSAVGETIVARLLAAQPPVRVVYKPHPFTGQRDAKYRFVHARIAAMIDRAASETGIDHRVVKGGPIIDWFNRSSALVTDISSVVSDFLASEKPYAVFNHTGEDDAAFVVDFPSTGAATIIRRDGTGIDEFVAVVTGQAPDVRAEDRARLATYLLGEPDQRTLEAFGRAVDDFVALSDERRSIYRGVSQANVPSTVIDDVAPAAGVAHLEDVDASSEVPDV